MKKITLTLSLVVFLITGVFSQKVIHLYEGKAPGSEDWNYNEIEFPGSTDQYRCVRNVVQPTLEVFIPDKSVATTTAVIVCPGGGNFYLEYDHEGTKIAEWLAHKGITAFVLKYRLKKTPEDLKEYNSYVSNFFKSITFPTEGNTVDNLREVVKNKFGGEDGLKAIEYVRLHAEEYGIDPQKVGIMGFSAGAWVTMYTILNSVPEKQPNFAAPIYGGWIDEEKVPASAPPIFIACAADDMIIKSAPDLYKAWRAAGKSAELHIFSKGNHGFGIRKSGLPVDGWIDLYYEWLDVNGFAEKQK